MGEARRRREAAGGTGSGSTDGSEPGFAEYAAELRSIFPHLSDQDIGKAWMRGEWAKAQGFDTLLVHRPGEKPRRHEDEIHLALIYGDKAFRAVIPPDLVEELISGWERTLKEVAMPPAGEERWFTFYAVKHGLLTNAIGDTPGVVEHAGAIMVAGTLWLIFTGEMGPAIRESKHRRFTYQITDKPLPPDAPPGTRIRQNWRLLGRR